MRKFLITHKTHWSGTIDVLYNNDILIRVDFQNAIIKSNVIKEFLQRLSPTIEQISKELGEKCVITESDFEITFEDFYNAYNNKVSKKRALAIWIKLNKADQLGAYLGIKPYNKFLTSTGFRQKADPDTYLRNRYWENEY